jgi:hypothetical protein
MPKIILALFFLLCAPSAFPEDCKHPLDQQTLDQLRLDWTDVQLRPGESHQFFLAILSSYMPAKEIPACARWKVAPEGKGATISVSGLLKIDSGVPAGSKFVITADIENGRAQRQIVAVVYTDAAQPLVGLWRQQTRTGCSTVGEITAVEPINELEFRADGTFSVTWTPFETYHDYWGIYTSDLAKQSLSLKIDQGNYVPADFRGKGAYKLKDKNTLELEGIYLGSQRNYKTPAMSKINRNCRYIFTKIP